MKIVLAQLNYHIANFQYNKEKIITSINNAKKENADLVVFSELAVCGYPPQDLLEHKEFLDECYKTINEISAYCEGIAVIIGAPVYNEKSFGKPLYNAALFIENKEIKHTIRKTLLPTYDIFDEYRYFESNRNFEIILYKGERIAVTICEDLWDEQPYLNPIGRSQLYNVSPMDEFAKLNPDFVINIAASPFAFRRIETKRDIFIKKSQKHHLPLFYLNQVGAHAELIFDGGSFVLNSQGEIINQMSLFEESTASIDTKNIIHQKAILHQPLNPIEQVHNALVFAIADFFAKNNFKQAVLGLSGGIDSAVVTVLAAKAIGAENVRVLLMPSKYSSDHSVDDSILLANKLGVQYDIVSIKDVYNSFESTLQPLFANTAENVAEENIQARIRGTLLMGISNKFGNILLNTTNKSEAAVGYGTLYGDMAGSISVIGDVYKTDLYKMAMFINSSEEIIPNNIITKAPSAELRPDQKDSDSLPEYPVLDGILVRYLEYLYPIDDIINDGYDAQLVKKVVRMVNNNEYKRYQAPPMLRISSKAFGMGRRMPLVAKY